MNARNIFPEPDCLPHFLVESERIRVPAKSFLFWKRVFDLLGAIILLIVMLFAAFLVAVLNRFLNPGPLFYVQDRMGKDCKPFRAIKFRSMACIDEISRGAFDDLEHDRIRPFGRFLRRARVDELPQAINVLIGDMSLIGPRPDFYKHALVYVDTVHGYRERHVMRPGISGYAQVHHGYIEGIQGVRAKVSADIQYITQASMKADTKIALKTIKVIALRQGK